jgi:hypothetical protein
MLICVSVLHGPPWGFFQQPVPIPVETHTHTYGCGFWQVQVWVSGRLAGLAGTHALRHSRQLIKVKTCIGDN